MCCKYYFGIVLTLLFLCGLAGCFKYFGTSDFWFWCGLSITTCAALMYIAET